MTNNFGDIMKAQMKHLGIKQEALAKELNIARTTVSAYCNNKRQPDIYMLSRICNILQINYAKVLNLPDKGDPEMWIKNPFELEVVSVCRQIVPDKQKKFLQAVRFLENILCEEEEKQEEKQEEHA